MTSLWQDARFGLRTIHKDRALFLSAVVALGLGIGSTTAIFSVIDNVLLRPFPYTDGQRLFAIEIHDKSSSDPFGRQFFSVPEFLDFQEQNHVFDRSIGVRRDPVLMGGVDSRESFDGATVTGNTFQFLGVAPLLGRAIAPDDAKPGAPPVFVLSYKVWQKRFGADPNIVGKTFIMNDKPTTLIGIMPQRFAWWGADLWVPTSLDRAEGGGPFARFFLLMGHLKPGLDPKAANADVQILANRLSKIYPKNYPKQFDAHVQSLVDNVVGRFRSTLYTLLAAVGFLLLIACANVANLLLAKATAREKELAIRTTLGAGRIRIVRQLLVESLLLSLAGTAVGCFFAWGGLKGLVALIPQFTFPDEADIRLNIPVLIATVATAVLTALVFGLAPALAASKRDLNQPLRASGRGHSGFGRGRLRNVLVVSEVALSLTLLAGAGLLMRSFLLGREIDLGIRTDHVLMTNVNLPAKQYKTTESQARFLRELLPRLQRLPGVISVSGALDFPPFGGIDTNFNVAGREHSETWKGRMVPCSSQFLETLHARLLRGRPLTEDDENGVRKVALVNETFVAKYFEHDEPLGRRIELTGLQTAPEPVANSWFEVVGVVSDMKNNGVRQGVLPEAFVPYTIAGYGGYNLYLRTANNPAALATALAGEVLRLDRSVIPNRTSTMDDMLDLNEYAQQRFGLILFSVFAGIGLILVSLGVYSVISYTVTQKRQEIGIRMALGASPGDVRGMVVTSGLRLIGIGAGIGVVMVFFAARVLSSQIYGVSWYDPLTLAGVIGVLAGAGLAASYLPSRRATRVDPAIALRYE
jgi:putative ABC transport system permease protein